MTGKKIAEEFNLIKGKYTIDKLIELGLLDINIREKILIYDEFNCNVKNNKMQMYQDLSEKYCKTIYFIMRIINKKIKVYF